MRHVGLPQQWIDASKPKIVGESKLAEPRLLGNEGLVAIDANIDRFLTARRSCGHAAFVQQRQLHGTVSCAHLDARGLQLSKGSSASADGIDPQTRASKLQVSFA